jgi:hypothetical protein
MKGLELRCKYLGSQHSLLHPREVSVRPGARGPRSYRPQVSGEVEPLQLVVYKVADVPGEVVVSVTKVQFVCSGTVGLPLCLSTKIWRTIGGVEEIFYARSFCLQQFVCSEPVMWPLRLSTKFWRCLEGVWLTLHAFLISLLDKGKWSNSRSDRFVPEEIAPWRPSIEQEAVCIKEPVLMQWWREKS